MKANLSCAVSSAESSTCPSWVKVYGPAPYFTRQDPRPLPLITSTIVGSSGQHAVSWEEGQVFYPPPRYATPHVGGEGNEMPLSLLACSPLMAHVMFPTWCTHFAENSWLAFLLFCYFGTKSRYIATLTSFRVMSNSYVAGSICECSSVRHIHCPNHCIAREFLFRALGCSDRGKRKWCRNVLYFHACCTMCWNCSLLTFLDALAMYFIQSVC